MSKEILALAEELCCGSYPKSNGVFYPAHNIESFYRAAYNKAIHDAVKACKKDASGRDSGPYFAEQIQALKTK